MYVLFLKEQQGCDRAALAATELPFPRQKERGGEWPAGRVWGVQGSGSLNLKP